MTALTDRVAAAIESLAGPITPSAEEIAETVLALFEISEEWLPADDRGHFDDRTIKPYASPLDALKDYGSDRPLQHRYVPTSPWHRIEAQVEWREAGSSGLTVGDAFDRPENW